ncbi:MAG: RNA methyltransferase [Eubacteriales bacterium]|nr:RNA methyltransferase [Eubacteriales bacterium]
MIDFISIESSENKLIKLVKSLSQKKYREKEGLFFTEGLRFVQDALDSSWEVSSVFVSETFKEKFIKTRKISLTNKNPELYCLPDKLFNEISDTNSPQGILAVIKMREYDPESVIFGPNLFLLLDGLQDPGNMGTIIRSADAAGFNAIIMTEGCVDIYNPKVVRSTAGSLFHIPCITASDVSKMLDLLRLNEIKIYCASASAKKYCYQFDLHENVVFAIGNEANGLSAKVTENADDSISIPILGRAESLNASVAAGILLYEAIRQRLA